MKTPDFTKEVICFFHEFKREITNYKTLFQCCTLVDVQYSLWMYSIQIAKVFFVLIILWECFASVIGRPFLPLKKSLGESQYS